MAESALKSSKELWKGGLKTVKKLNILNMTVFSVAFPNAEIMSYNPAQRKKLEDFYERAIRRVTYKRVQGEHFDLVKDRKERSFREICLKWKMPEFWSVFLREKRLVWLAHEFRTAVREKDLRIPNAIQRELDQESNWGKQLQSDLNTIMGTTNSGTKAKSADFFRKWGSQPTTTRHMKAVLRAAGQKWMREKLEQEREDRDQFGAGAGDSDSSELSNGGVSSGSSESSESVSSGNSRDSSGEESA